MTLLTKMLARGDTVEIAHGKLVVTLASNQQFHQGHYRDFGSQIEQEIMAAVGVPAFRFVSYSTGQYGGGKYSGVTLQFVDVVTGQSAYACFNATITRQRTRRQGGKGMPLPKGQFRVNKKSGFVRFWNNTGLPTPPRYYDRMGNLEHILFNAEISQGEKLVNSSIKPVNINRDQLNLTTNSRLSHDQATTNSRLRTTTKETPQSQTQQGLEHDSNYGGDLLRLKAIREDGYKGKVIPIHTELSNQSVDEWLNSYENAKPSWEKS